VSRWGTRLATTFAAAALLAFAALFSSCGDSDSGSTSAGTSAEAEAKSGGQGNSGKNGGSQPFESEDSEGKARPNASVPVGPLRVSGGGSGQFRVKGGDNSIQDFGEEASESELEEAAKALHDFYVGRAREEWRRACANLSKLPTEQLRQLTERAQQGSTECPSALAAITPSLPAKVARETTAVDAGSLRVEGDRGFLIYRDEEGAVYAINMANEDGWKVGALAGVPLS
jgi:hypothetical protein